MTRPLDPNSKPEGYEPPGSAEDLLERYAKGERYFVGARLREADLSAADLSGVNLSGAILRKANLRGAILHKADFSNGNLFQANLSGAKLWGANLSKTDLAESDLSGARLTSVRWSNQTSLEGRGKGRFRGIRLEGAYGSPLFVRFAADRDYVENYSRSHPIKGILWWLLADYGQSLTRFALWAVLLSVIFGAVMSWCPSWFVIEPLRDPTPWTYFYYSIVTFTTLGFGDVKPVTLGGEILVTMEVILGYVMLGGLISILAQKLARRS